MPLKLGQVSCYPCNVEAMLPTAKVMTRKNFHPKIIVLDRNVCDMLLKRLVPEDMLLIFFD